MKARIGSGWFDVRRPRAKALCELDCGAVAEITISGADLPRPVDVCRSCLDRTVILARRLNAEEKELAREALQRARGARFDLEDE